MVIFKFLLVALLGYIIGSIPWGLITGRIIARVDIRQYGSGRTGGTNVLRTLGRRAFLLVALLDIAKGVVSVLIAGAILGGDILSIGNSGLGAIFAQILAGMAAVTGHVWPVFAGFRGGRGVATFFGALIAMCPPAGLFGGALLIITALISGYASLGSITGIVGAYAMLVPLTLLCDYPLEYLIFALLGTLFIILTHHDNIKRLLAGKERRFNIRVKLGGNKSEDSPENDKK
ncbi:MAG: glycerol-3-phosphate 1-O-acyltransferase PlsY [Dehalococcoidales bacterium]|nr:glycerol-3-phosphate 1-O-acyltransferase PlsY [Dehalococcoidales bacterium]MDD4230303.1 glycerol-3-phosphate 1-O-acyltransferase PlsY [Dehalococcoidales bacterium]MDD4465362.1 glycerol-3-phosphate 1-O-acyltransferase PlsY [Dehalococcoidales bacterium]MDD5402046.1 glycerol-3-phosphate 1-O-acyltransferase PlsY [Dehalococcoidales bacterium]